MAIYRQIPPPPEPKKPIGKSYSWFIAITGGGLFLIILFLFLAFVGSFYPADPDPKWATQPEAEYLQQEAE